MKASGRKVSYLFLAALLGAIVLSGCAVTSPIQPLTTSKSSFDDAVYPGETVTIGEATAGEEAWRVFHQGASSFVSIQSIRAEAESRATEFCGRRSKVMRPLRETNSKPPHILGNFPRVEIVFECTNRPQAAVAPKSGPTISTGTGFAVRSRTTLVTAFHVIDGAQAIEASCGDGKPTSAKVERIDPANDLALLRLAEPTSHSLELAPENSIAIGQKVFTIGYPVPGLLGIDAKYSDGAISSLSGIQGAANLLQVTVPIQPGNSGGPLVDDSGRVVAVITSTAAVQGFLRRTGSLPQNINWAVRSEYVRPLLAGIPSTPAKLLGTAVEIVRQSTCMLRVTGA